MKKIKLYVSFLLLMLSVSMWSYSSLAMDYCDPKGKKISITLVVPKNFNKTEKNIQKSSFKSLIKNLKPGDYVSFNLAKQDLIEPVRLYSQCFPGCPPSKGTLWGEIFGIGVECNVTRMQRDKKLYEKSLALPIYYLLNKQDPVIKDGVTNLLASLENIANFNKTNDFDEVYIISSMNPFPSTNIESKKIDSFFVELVQNNKIPKNLPNAIYVGVLQNSKLILFWQDIYKTIKTKFDYR